MSGGSSLGMRREVSSKQRLETRFVLKITGDVATPVIASGASDNWTIARNGLGDYTLTSANGAERSLQVAGAVGNAADTAVCVLATTSTTVQIQISDFAAAKDEDCTIEVVHYGSKDET